MKTITLRISDEIYDLFKYQAIKNNRPLSNLIETATLRYLENENLVNEFEMQEILNNKSLQKDLKKGSREAKKMLGKFV